MGFQGTPKEALGARMAPGSGRKSGRAIARIVALACTVGSSSGGVSAASTAADLLMADALVADVLVADVLAADVLAADVLAADVLVGSALAGTGVAGGGVAGGGVAGIAVAGSVLAAGSVTAAGVLVPVAVAHAQSMTDEDLSAAMAQLRQGTPEERTAAAELLGRRAYRHRDQVAPVLRDLIRNDTDWRVRASAGRALGRLGTRDAVPDLVRALRDPVVDVRVVAAAAIWRLPDPAAVPALIELLQDQDASARQWAALALGVIRDVRAVPALLPMLRDPEPAVRLDVIRSLGRIRDAAAVQPLEQYARDDTRPRDERLEAVSSLATIQGPEKVDALVRLLDSPSRDVRQRVIESLGQVGDALVIPALRRRRGSEVGAMRGAIDGAIREIEERAREGTPAGGGGASAPALP